VIVLGIDTSTQKMSVGLTGPEGLMGELTVSRGSRHSELLTESIQQLLALADLNVKALNGVAVATGPGSFTGLRIGLGTAKGMALGADLPLVGVPTMEAYLDKVPEPMPLACILLPSRKREYYRAVFKHSGGQWLPLEPVKLCLEDALFQGLTEGPCCFLGEGAWTMKKPILERANAHVLPLPIGGSSGYHVAAAGRRRLLNGEVDDVDALIPVYHQPFQGID